MKSREERGTALADYVQILWERRWLIVVFLGLTTAFAFVTRPEQPQAFHRAQVILRVQILSVTGAGTSTNPTGVPPAEIEAVRSPEVASETARELGLADGGIGLLQRLEVQAIQNTDLLQVAMQGRGSRTSHELQAYTKNYVEYRNRLDQEKLARALQQVDRALAGVQQRLRQLANATGGRAAPIDLQTQIDATTTIYRRFLELREQIQLDSVLSGSTVQQIGSPIEQRLGVIPTRTLRMIAGPIVGLILGAALAIALGMLRPRVSSRERAEDRLGSPVLASIPLVKAHGVSRDPILIQRSSPWGVEGVRMLLAELQLLEKRAHNRVRVVVVASPQSGDGRTALAVNLAASYAVAGRSVALLRADRVIEVEEEAQRETVGRFDTIQVKIHRDGFAEVVPKVIRSRNQPGLVGDALNRLLSDLADDFDVVIIDTRPITVSADALLLAGQADAVVLVVRQHQTSEARAIESVEILDRHDVKLIGIVMNAVRTPFVDRYRARSAAAARRHYREVRDFAARQREAARAQQQQQSTRPLAASRETARPQSGRVADATEAPVETTARTLSIPDATPPASPTQAPPAPNGEVRESDEIVAHPATALPPDAGY